MESDQEKQVVAINANQAHHLVRDILEEDKELKSAEATDEDHKD
ncbi:hypothetical protein AAG897_12680 [Lacticaseibacillus rhamnosus]|nr:hypothetical protein [Lacticaseibacillus rhamnosus]